MKPAEKKPSIAYALTVSGRVQGVGFRDWTVRTARRLGVAGWVRNTDNGAVEVRAEGTREAVEAFIQALHTGPELARVESVRSAQATPRGYTSFEFEY